MSTKQHETRGPSADMGPKEPGPESSKPAPSDAVVSEAADASDRESADADSALSLRNAVLEAELAAAREELSAVNDKYLRKLADDVNFRKRMAREKEDSQRFAVASLLGDLIPILDDFDRAVISAETLKDYAVLHDGVVLIKRQLATLLETKYGLSRLESVGTAFDPNQHEAVAVIQGGPEDGEETVVAEEYLPCYKLHDRILRTAKVRVRMPTVPDPSSDAPSGAAESNTIAN